RHSIMTEKLARRGTTVRTDYTADFLSQIPVQDAMTGDVVSLRADDAVDRVRSWLSDDANGIAHQGFPVLDDSGTLVGVVTRRDLFDGKEAAGRRVRDVVKRPPAVAFERSTLREAADHMVREKVGRLPVVERRSGRLVGIITRSDLLSAHERRLR